MDEDLVLSCEVVVRLLDTVANHLKTSGDQASYSHACMHWLLDLAGKSEKDMTLSATTEKAIRVRFAPSPTGFMHLGGVRTALFNWLFAKKNNGKFVLRIDDTDNSRNRKETIQPILDAFSWLGIDWDEGPYYQSDRLERYRKKVYKLIEMGLAYPDESTPSQSARMTHETTRQNKAYRGKERNTNAIVNLTSAIDGNYPIRLSIPENRRIEFQDLVRGEVGWSTNTVSDPIIMRTDGMPLYNLASAIDDIDMNISHVIRSEEHLTNTAIQLLICEYFDKKPPIFAHLPYVAEPNNHKKMSKRFGGNLLTKENKERLSEIGISDLNPVSVQFYKEVGYIPEAVVNYLARLGWSLDGKTEIISTEDLIQNFSFYRVGSSPSSFDPSKLYWLNGEYMKKVLLEDKAKNCLPFLQKCGAIPEEVSFETMSKHMEVVAKCTDRLKVYSDIVHYGAFFFRNPTYTNEAVRSRLGNPDVINQMREFHNSLDYTTIWTHDTLEGMLRDYCYRINVKPNDLVHALRVVLSGHKTGISLFDIMVMLGKKETLNRIKTWFVSDVPLRQAKNLIEQ